jgi:hypothetical protein
LAVLGGALIGAAIGGALGRWMYGLIVVIETEKIELQVAE